MLLGRLSSAEIFTEGGGISGSERLECLALGPQSGEVEPVLLRLYLSLLDSRPPHFLFEVSFPTPPACPWSRFLANLCLAWILDCADFCGVQ